MNLPVKNRILSRVVRGEVGPYELNHKDFAELRMTVRPGEYELLPGGVMRFHGIEIKEKHNGA